MTTQSQPTDQTVDQQVDQSPAQDDLTDQSLPPFAVRKDAARKRFDEAVSALRVFDVSVGEGEEAIRALEEQLAQAKTEQKVKVDGRDEHVAAATAASQEIRALHREFEASLVG